jgi:hypothetical protein
VEGVKKSPEEECPEEAEVVPWWPPAKAEGPEEEEEEEEEDGGSQLPSTRCSREARRLGLGSSVLWSGRGLVEQ